MTNVLNSFCKRKEFLVCIDSDGCAMDTMDIKHIHCFGPCMICEWNLEPWEKEIQERWNAINLYTMTRGINRFLGLFQALKEINDQYSPIEDLEDLENWVNTAAELSNASLAEAMKESPSPILGKALNWSVMVNQSIVELPEENKLPFEGVRACLEKIHTIADVAVVSSANQQAIMEEWGEHDLLSFADVILSQNAGSKAFCIETLVEKGYDKNKVLMIGDAPGDREAAESNGVLFYPILVRKESESWERFMTQGIKEFVEGTYQGAYHKQMIMEFEQNLSI